MVLDLVFDLVLGVPRFAMQKHYDFIRCDGPIGESG